MSNVIKSNRYIPLEEKRKLEAVVHRPPEAPGEQAREEATRAQAAPAERETIEAAAAAEQLLSDAKQAADELLRHAAEEAERRLGEASKEIERWWDERRAHDLQVVEDSKRSGYESGYQEGLKQAEAEISEAYEALLQEARNLVTEAHRVKESVIAEAEPFLVELSTAIAKKIVGEHLAIEPDWALVQVKRTLERRRDKGLITLCIAPSQFSKMQDARAELTLSVDSEAELVIVPDATVDEGGCVVRSAFGSIDARIDTQLAELKAALMEIASRSDEEGMA